MSLVSLLVTLIVVGVVLYLLQLIPLDETIKKVIRVIVIAFVIIWAIRVFLGSAADISIP